jgi:hypothetical protein
MRQLIAAPIRMIVGATLPSARVGEGLETTQPRHFASVIAKGSLGAPAGVAFTRSERPLSDSKAVVGC